MHAEVKNTIRIQVPSVELRDHLIERADYHERRAAEKAPLVPQLREADDALNRRAPGAEDAQADGALVAQFLSNNSYAQHGRVSLGDQAEMLEREVEDHKRRARALRFTAMHLKEEAYEFDVPLSDQLRWPLI